MTATKRIYVYLEDETIIRVADENTAVELFEEAWEDFQTELAEQDDNPKNFFLENYGIEDEDEIFTTFCDEACNGTLPTTLEMQIQVWELRKDDYQYNQIMQSNNRERKRKEEIK